MSKERKSKDFLHKPEYPGGTAALKQFIADHIQYPAEAIKAGIDGSVRLRYDINHKGVVIGAKIISGLGYGCDEEAIRLVKLLKFQIAKNRGIRATFHKRITIHFRKMEQKEKTAPPPTTTTIQYNYTKSKPSSEKEKKPKPSSGYNYNINF